MGSEAPDEQEKQEEEDEDHAEHGEDEKQEPGKSQMHHALKSHNSLSKNFLLITRVR